VNLNNLVTYS